MTDLLDSIGRSWPLVTLLVFVAAYPLVTACVWIATSVIYAWHRERTDDGGFYDLADGDLPRVTLLVPAFREGEALDPALERLHHLDYPDYEVLVVDDGSPDSTAAVARAHVERDRRFRLLRKEVNGPRALVDMTVPGTAGALWRQRRRWATGLVQVLRRHWRLGLSWRSRRQWPVLAEAALSILWAHAFVLLLAFWLLCLATDVTPRGASPFPNGWGMLIGSLCLVQLAVGVFLDSRYDRSVRRSYLIAPVYPLVYWALMAAVTVRSTLPAMLRSGRPALAIWHTPRAVVEAREPDRLPEAS